VLLHVDRHGVEKEASADQLNQDSRQPQTGEYQGCGANPFARLGQKIRWQLGSGRHRRGALGRGRELPGDYAIEAHAAAALWMEDMY